MNKSKSLKELIIYLSDILEKHKKYEKSEDVIALKGIVERLKKGWYDPKIGLLGKDAYNVLADSLFNCGLMNTSDEVRQCFYNLTYEKEKK